MYIAIDTCAYETLHTPRVIHEECPKFYGFHALTDEILAEKHPPEACPQAFSLLDASTHWFRPPVHKMALYQRSLQEHLESLLSGIPWPSAGERWRSGTDGLVAAAPSQGHRWTSRTQDLAFRWLSKFGGGHGESSMSVGGALPWMIKTSYTSTTLWKHVGFMKPFRTGPCRMLDFPPFGTPSQLPLQKQRCSLTWTFGAALGGCHRRF